MSAQLIHARSSDSFFNIPFFSNLMPKTLGPSLGYFVSDRVELKVSPSFGYQSLERSSFATGSILQITAGASYSFGDNFDHSFFVTLEAGLRRIDLFGQNNTRLASVLSFGRRYLLTNSFAYAPQISLLEVIPQDGESVLGNWMIIPAQVTLLF